MMGKGKVSSKATTMTRRIAKSRVHVERMIRKLECFQLIRGVIPLTIKPYASSIIHVCACHVNLSPSIIDDHDDDDNKGVQSEDSEHYDWECKDNSCDSEDNEEGKYNLPRNSGQRTHVKINHVKYFLFIK